MTEEMKNIIYAKDKHIAVIAKSGAGKSSTMLEYIKANPTEKILFLVYNKEMQREFSQRVKGVQHHAQISTIHSLAYRWFIKNYGKRSFKNINVIDIKNFFKRSNLEFSELNQIKFYYDMFLSSDKEDPQDLQFISNEHRYVIPYVRKLFEHYKTSSQTQHNVYLKMFQLAKEKIVGYDTIILDEANDSNKCMIAIIENNLDKKIIIVGDPLQNLNAFNHTFDGLNYVIDNLGFKRYDLTMSFRISDNVAQFSSKYLTYMYGETINFHGCKTSRISTFDVSKANSQNQLTILCRNRLYGLKTALEIAKKHRNKRIFFVGGLDAFGLSEMEKILSFKGNVYLGGERYHISDLRPMLDKNDDTRDAEIQRVVSLFDFGNKYRKELPFLQYMATTNRDEADIIIQTAHSSKGLTVKNVMLTNDFLPIEDLRQDLRKALEKGNEYKINLLKSEINLLYVAITRATEITDIGEVFNKTSKRQVKDYEEYREDL